VHFVYSTDGVTGKGEKSRFLMQIEKEMKCDIEYRSVDLKRKIFAWQPLPAIAKDEIPKTSSPSAINTYIDCKMKYCFSRVLRLKNHDETADELSSVSLGNILHKTIELVYTELGSKVSKEQIKNYIDRIDEFIRRSFTPSTGEEMLYFNIVKQMTRNILEYDISLAPFNIIGLEKKCSINIDSTLIEGYVDRIIEKDGTIYVQDFKTGKYPSDNDFDNIATVFSEDRKYKDAYILQLLIYSAAIAKEYPDKKIIPVLLFAIADKERVAVDVVSKINDAAVTFDDVKDIFDSYFLHFFKDDFTNRNIPFTQRENKDTEYGACGFCDYKSLCGL
jgi:ATP-dependent helicase/DNAse subunit B